MKTSASIKALAISFIDQSGYGIIERTIANAIIPDFILSDFKSPFFIESDFTICQNRTLLLSQISN